MATRCPGATAAGPAFLRGWRFIIMRGGYASVVPALGSGVHGVLWRVAVRDLAMLNAYESLDSGLYVRRELPVRRAGHLRPALIYVGHTRERGRPDPAYQAEIVAAAQAWGLPASYVQELARWSPGRWRGARKAEPGAAA